MYLSVHLQEVSEFSLLSGTIRLDCTCGQKQVS